MRHPAASKNGAHPARRPPGLRFLRFRHRFAMRRNECMCRRRIRCAAQPLPLRAARGEVGRGADGAGHQQESDLLLLKNRTAKASRSEADPSTVCACVRHDRKSDAARFVPIKSTPPQPSPSLREREGEERRGLAGLRWPDSTVLAQASARISIIRVSKVTRARVYDSWLLAVALRCAETKACAVPYQLRRPAPPFARSAGGVGRGAEPPRSISKPVS